jgi:hypothetical protein
MLVCSASSLMPEQLKDYVQPTRAPALRAQPSVGIAGMPI